MLALDVSDPAAPRVLGYQDLPGAISDSRKVGDVIYVVTYQDSYCWDCDAVANTRISSFDVSDPGVRHPARRDAIEAAHVVAPPRELRPHHLPHRAGRAGDENSRHRRLARGWSCSGCRGSLARTRASDPHRGVPATGRVPAVGARPRAGGGLR